MICICIASPQQSDATRNPYIFAIDQASFSDLSLSSRYSFPESPSQGNGNSFFQALPAFYLDLPISQHLAITWPSSSSALHGQFSSSVLHMNVRLFLPQLVHAHTEQEKL
jgi:hypothetical protein